MSNWFLHQVHQWLREFWVTVIFIKSITPWIWACNWYSSSIFNLIIFLIFAYIWTIQFYDWTIFFYTPPQTGLGAWPHAQFGAQITEDISRQWFRKDICKLLRRGYISWPHAQFGAQITEDISRQWFGRDICKLLCSGYISDDKRPNSQLLTNEMIIYFDVWCGSGTLSSPSCIRLPNCHKITWKVYIGQCQYHEGWRANEGEPSELSNCICHCMIFGLCTRSSYSGLFLGTS